MIRTLLSIVVAAGTLACVGCETESPYFDSYLGTSSAHMVQAQTLDPATNENPPALAPAGADGQRMKTAVDQYHKDVPKPQQTVERPIVFDVSAPSGGG